MAADPSSRGTRRNFSALSKARQAVAPLSSLNKIFVSRTLRRTLVPSLLGHMGSAGPTSAAFPVRGRLPTVAHSPTKTRLSRRCHSRPTERRF